MLCPHGQGGGGGWVGRRAGGGGGGEVEPVRIFCGQGGRVQFFAILCRRLVWTNSKLKYCLEQFKISKTVLFSFLQSVTGLQL